MSLIVAWLIAFVFVALVSAAIVGYGLIAAMLCRHAISSLVLGAGLYTSAILVTGIWGGYSTQVQTLLLGVGLVALWTYRRQLRRFLPQAYPQGRDRWWLILPVVYALTRFFACGLPQQHSDALYYHLAAPQLWVELGRIQLTAEHPSYSQAALWETLYGLPQIWLGTKGVVNHVIVQIYAQWLHFLWGQLGCVAVATALLVRLAPMLRARLGLAIFIAWLCTTQPAFEWLGCLAKNDYILALFVLAAVLEATEKRWLLAGLLVGLAYSTKVLAAWAAIALIVFIPWRKWPVYLVGATIAAAPFLFRNYYWTHNPFFPNLDNVIGPHWISSWWINHNLSFGGDLRFDPSMFGWMSAKMLEKMLPKIMLGFGIIALGSEALRRLRHRSVAGGGSAKWLGFIVIQLVLAFLMLRPLADGRYGILVAMSAALFAMAAAVREVAIRVPRAWPIVAFALVPLGLLINSPIDQLVKIPRDYWFGPAEHYVEQFHPVYDMQSWVQKHVSAEGKILFLAEKQQFYLDRPFETVVEMKKWEGILTPIKSAHALFATLRGLGYDYAHFSPQAGGYPIAIRPYWNEITALSDRVVFRSATSLVFDLRPSNPAAK